MCTTIPPDSVEKPNSFSVGGIKLYNTLPTNLRINNSDKMDDALKKIFGDKPFYSLFIYWFCTGQFSISLKEGHESSFKLYESKVLNSKRESTLLISKAPFTTKIHYYKFVSQLVSGYVPNWKWSGTRVWLRMYVPGTWLNGNVASLYKLFCPLFSRSSAACRRELEQFHRKSRHISRDMCWELVLMET